MINKAILVGNVGQDPETRTLSNGTKVAKFSLATSESWRDQHGDWQERTEWHNIVVWNEGSVKYVENNVRKGDRLFVEGKIETRKWQDQNGQDRYTTEIVLRPFSGNVKKVPGGDRNGRDRDDDRDRSRDRDRRDDRRDDRRSSSQDFDDEIPF